MAVMAILWILLLQQTAVAVTQHDYITWIAPIVLVIAFIPVAALAAVILDPRVYFVYSLALPFAYLLFFPSDIFAVLSITFLFFGLWRTFHRTAFELNNNIKFAPSHIMRRVSSIIILVILLTVAFNIYSRVSSEISQDPNGFYARLSNLMTRGILPVVERQLDNFNPNDTIDQFIVKGFTDTEPSFRDLPAEERQVEIEQSRERLLDQLGITAQGSDLLSDVTRKAIQERIREFSTPNYLWVIPVIYALAVFSVLRLLSVVVRLIAQAWGMFLFWLLKKSNFFKISTTQILAEHVEI